ncbi:RNA pseudouridine synthase [Spirosoma sp. SC4-14]|uniref:RluA family pseudouridine synthase n=1 Tax=Spirosoma sp. SC4-14 TaxID=3128900 RepID=UPI0030D30F16
MLEEFTLDIIYEDNNFAVINKPTGLSMFNDKTCSKSFWDLLERQFNNKKIFQVHRLDKGTSGLILIAFSKNVQAQLNRQFCYRKIEKYYLVICIGQPYPPSGKIDLPLSPGRKNRFRVAGNRKEIFVDNSENYPTWKLRESGSQSLHNSYPSVTFYETVLSNGYYSLLVVKPITGRTHQIRVHLSWIGYQLFGDTIYGKPNSTIQRACRLALHSFRLKLIESWIEGQEFVQKVFKTDIPIFFINFFTSHDTNNMIEISFLYKKINRALSKLDDMSN